MKTYDTPYGKKNALLLMLSMDAYTREEKADALIKELTKKLRQYAPTNATHEGIENCDLIVKANQWIEKRKEQIGNTEFKANQEQI